MWRRFLGLGILIVVAFVIGVTQFLRIRGENSTASAPPLSQITVKGYVGSEKEGLLQDPEVQRILRDRYGITVSYTKLGSLEMVRQDTAGLDYLWPANQVALDLFRERQGKVVKTSNVFNSPLVFYSWQEVADALIGAKVVEKSGESYFLDYPAFVKLNEDGKSWSDLGLAGVQGRVAAVSTDPTKSSSGSMYASLLTTAYLGGNVPDDANIASVLPRTQAYYRRLGYLWPSSKDLFEQYLTSGKGAFPVIVDYESLLIEFSLQNKQSMDVLRTKIRVLYPRPTVWSTHPLIALTPNGARLVDAVQDKDIQRLAWENHGFRAGLLGLQNDPKVLSTFGLPERIESSVPLPRPSVMDQIIRTLS